MGVASPHPRQGTAEWRKSVMNKRRKGKHKTLRLDPYWKFVRKLTDAGENSLLTLLLLKYLEF